MLKIHQLEKNASATVTKKSDPKYDDTISDRSIFSNSQQSVKLNQTKAFHTALCFIPPQSIWDPIQDIRRKLDKSFNRWPPHINLLFPFIPEQYFDEAAKLITEQLAHIEPFELTFDGVSCFEKKTSVIWLSQNETAVEKMREVQSAVASLFPYCDEKHDENGKFVPHLTIGQYSPKGLQKKLQELRTNWKSTTVQVGEICMIYRPDQESSFSVIHRIPLGSGLNK